jgi:hypothetical protein
VTAPADLSLRRARRDRDPRSGGALPAGPTAQAAAAQPGGDGQERPWVGWLRDRARRWSRPEVVAGALIAAGWAATGGFAVGGGWTVSGSLPVAVAAAVGIVVMHLAAVESGNHTLAWMTTGLVGAAALVTLASLDRDTGPLVYAAAATTTLAHSDLIRVGYARRRRADVDPGIYRQAAAGVVLAGVAGAAAILVAQVMSSGTDRNWLWMPATVGALVLAAAALAVLPVRSAPPSRRERWRPGDRLPPPPPDDGAHGWTQEEGPVV